MAATHGGQPLTTMDNTLIASVRADPQAASELLARLHKRLADQAAAGEADLFKTALSARTLAAMIDAAAGEGTALGGEPGPAEQATRVAIDAIIPRLRALMQALAIGAQQRRTIPKLLV